MNWLRENEYRNERNLAGESAPPPRGQQILIQSANCNLSSPKYTFSGLLVRKKVTVLFQFLTKNIEACDFQVQR